MCVDWTVMYNIPIENEQVLQEPPEYLPEIKGFDRPYIYKIPRNVHKPKYSFNLKITLCYTQDSDMSAIFSYINEIDHDMYYVFRENYTSFKSPVFISENNVGMRNQSQTFETEANILFEKELNDVEMQSFYSYWRRINELY